MNNYHISIKNAGKRFKDKEVLSEINMECDAGHIYGIVGHNGSGKTVLLKCICGFLRCTEGEIRINQKKMGKDIHMLTDEGIIIEEPSFLRRKSGMKNLEYLYTLRNKYDRNHLEQVMRQVGLDPASRKPVGKYSLGMRQRLAIAQAIMEDPPVLILDEPMNGLDHRGIDEMRELFSEMKHQGKLMLFASHNQEDIRILCDEVYELEDGHLLGKNTVGKEKKDDQ